MGGNIFTSVRCFVFSFLLLGILPFVVTARDFPSPTSESFNACTATAGVIFKADQLEAKSDFFITVGNAFNLSDTNETLDLIDTAAEELQEANELNVQQRQVRLEICKKLGPGPYDPTIVPAQFIDFEAVLSGSQTFTPNPHFPLVPGTVWEYSKFDEEGDVIEKGIVEVLSDTREILGVHAITVRDRVFEVENGEQVLVEDTLDWFGQHQDGTVWYFGELAQNFVDGRLDNLEGSWLAGVDFAKPGRIMLANPRPGNFYRQEFLPTVAEDVARVTTRGTAVVQTPLQTFSTDVVQTKDFTPLEPGVIELKFYAPGVGLVKEFNPQDNETNLLTRFTQP